MPKSIANANPISDALGKVLERLAANECVPYGTCLNTEYAFQLRVHASQRASRDEGCRLLDGLKAPIRPQEATGDSVRPLMEFIEAVPQFTYPRAHLVNGCGVDELVDITAFWWLRCQCYVYADDHDREQDAYINVIDETCLGEYMAIKHNLTALLMVVRWAALHDRTEEPVDLTEKLILDFFNGTFSGLSTVVPITPTAACIVACGHPMCSQRDEFLQEFLCAALKPLWLDQPTDGKPSTAPPFDWMMEVLFTEKDAFRMGSCLFEYDVTFPRIGPLYAERMFALWAVAGVASFIKHKQAKDTEDEQAGDDAAWHNRHVTAAADILDMLTRDQALYFGLVSMPTFSAYRPPDGMNKYLWLLARVAFWHTESPGPVYNLLMANGSLPNKDERRQRLMYICIAMLTNGSMQMCSMQLPDVENKTLLSVCAGQPCEIYDTGIKRSVIGLLMAYGSTRQVAYCGSRESDGLLHLPWIQDLAKAYGATGGFPPDAPDVDARYENSHSHSKGNASHLFVQKLADAVKVHMRMGAADDQNSVPPGAELLRSDVEEWVLSKPSDNAEVALALREQFFDLEQKRTDGHLTDFDPIFNVHGVGPACRVSIRDLVGRALLVLRLSIYQLLISAQLASLLNEGLNTAVVITFQSTGHTFTFARWVAASDRPNAEVEGPVVMDREWCRREQVGYMPFPLMNVAYLLCNMLRRAIRAAKEHAISERTISEFTASAAGAAEEGTAEEGTAEEGTAEEGTGGAQLDVSSEIVEQAAAMLREDMEPSKQLYVPTLFYDEHADFTADFKQKVQGMHAQNLRSGSFFVGCNVIDEETGRVLELLRSRANTDSCLKLITQEPNVAAGSCALIASYTS